MQTVQQMAVSCTDFSSSFHILILFFVTNCTRL